MFGGGEGNAAEKMRRVRVGCIFRFFFFTPQLAVECFSTVSNYFKKRNKKRIWSTSV